MNYEELDLITLSSPLNSQRSFSTDSKFLFKGLVFRSTEGMVLIQICKYKSTPTKIPVSGSMFSPLIY